MKFTKAQSLPLNTIVIALLVVIVLVVIVLFFTQNLSESNKTFTDLSNSCDVVCDGLGKKGKILSLGETCSMNTREIEGEECCCGDLDDSSEISNLNSPIGVSSSNSFIIQ